MQPHSYYITNIFETKEQVLWVGILADFEDTLDFLAFGQTCVMKNKNSEFVFILNEIKYICRKIGPDTKKYLPIHYSISKGTRPLSFEKKKSAYKNGGRCSYGCNYIPLVQYT